MLDTRSGALYFDDYVFNPVLVLLCATYCGVDRLGMLVMWQAAMCYCCVDKLGMLARWQALSFSDYVFNTVLVRLCAS